VPAVLLLLTVTVIEVELLKVFEVTATSDPDIETVELLVNPVPVIVKVAVVECFEIVSGDPAVGDVMEGSDGPVTVSC
jgi:hypothetical protein